MNEDREKPIENNNNNKGSVVLWVNDLTQGVNTAKKSMGFVCMPLFASLSME